MVGSGLPNPIALVTLSELGNSSSFSVLSNSLIQTLNDLNNRLEKHEKIKKVVVFKDQWTIENNFFNSYFKAKKGI